MTESLQSAKASRKRGRWKRILKRVALSLIVLFLVFAFGVFPYWLSYLVTSTGTRPMDRRLTETPADFGVDFQEVAFATSDGVDISGWLIPGQADKATIVYSHGLLRSRRELLKRAIDLWRLGYGALLYDSRNHGDSGKARVTLGYKERLDAQAAVRFLRDTLGPNRRVVLYGISMGAVAALLAAAETREVSAVVADSAFLSFEDTTDHHVKTFLRIPAFPIANEVRFFMEHRADFDGGKLNTLEAVKRMDHMPILFIGGANDRRMPPDIARRLREASMSPRSDLLIVDGQGSHIHGHSYQTAPELYIERVSGFLKAASAA